MKRELYKSSWNIVVVVVCMISTIVFLGYLKNSNELIAWQQNMITAFPVILFMVALAVYSRITTYLEIDDGILVVSGVSNFTKQKIPIKDIKYIRRVPLYAWKSKNNRLVFYLRDSEGGLMHVIIKEKAYSGDTIKNLLLRIRDIHPQVDLDNEYLDLLNGKIKAEDFLSTPTQKSLEEVERELREKDKI